MSQPLDVTPTIFAVVRMRDGRFAVEMTKPGQTTVSIKPFWTEKEAQEWIEVEKRRTDREEP
jgi:hypothetical protein